MDRVVVGASGTNINEIETVSFPGLYAGRHRFGSQAGASVLNGAFIYLCTPLKMRYTCRKPCVWSHGTAS